MKDARTFDLSMIAKPKRARVVFEFPICPHNVSNFGIRPNAAIRSLLGGDMRLMGFRAYVLRNFWPK